LPETIIFVVTNSFTSYPPSSQKSPHLSPYWQKSPPSSVTSSASYPLSYAFRVWLSLMHNELKQAWGT